MTKRSIDNWVDQRLRAAALRKLEALAGGQLTVIDPCGVEVYGKRQQSTDISAVIRIHCLSFYRYLAWDGANGVGEAYLDGLWDSDDVTRLLQLFARNVRLAAGLGNYWSKRVFGRWTDWIRRRWRRNTVAGSKQNIAAHYDLSNEFFSLFLDSTMAYSAGIFDEDAGGAMEGASLSKFARVCRKLQLESSDHLLEIGSGWGGLAIYAAEQTGCRVTTTTISSAQYEFARAAVRRAGLEDRVDVLCKDYRELQGSYDKIVSIEMIEAVGYQYYNSFFRQCERLLRPDGLMMLQAILIPQQRYDRYRRSQDFIQRHIFPGGCLPSLTALTDAAADATDLQMVEMDDFADHYARTLQLWRREFNAKRAAVKRLGMDDRFIRAWHYYLCYCEAGFRERQLQLAHLLFSASNWRGNSALASANWSSVDLQEGVM